MTSYSYPGIEGRMGGVNQDTEAYSLTQLICLQEPRMNPETGSIAQFETEEDAKLAGYTKSLTDKEAKLLATMNRHDRRAWLSRKRKERRMSSRAR